MHFINRLVICFGIMLALGYPLLAQQRPEPAQRTKLPQTKQQTTQNSNQATDQAARGRGSQIVDDSTKNVYGPKTTLWTTEEDIFLNRKYYRPKDTILTNYRALDTTLNNYHRWTYVQRYNNLLHDLGNLGTALNSVFPEINSTIGATTGFNVYKLYYDTQEPVYFNTKSPYTSFRLVWGGDGRAASKIEYSRNINSRWNFGFNFRPILVDKQIQRRGKGDRQTISYYYDIYTSYKSKNSRYTLLANAKRFRHRVNENGGVLLVRDTTFAGYFDQNASPYLLKAQTEDKRYNLHLYHQYQLAKPFQVYQRLDVGRQYNGFTDAYASETNYTSYFKYTTKATDVDTTNVADGVEFKTIVNEAGIKGNAAFLFYNIYYKLRKVSTYNKYVDETQLAYDNDPIENYVGGRIAFRFDSLSELTGKAEYLLDGNYFVEAKLSTPWLDARATSSLAKPSYLNLAYRGSHNNWSNNFDDTFSNQLEGFIKARWKGIFISPGLHYTILSKYIFYRYNDKPGEQAVLPIQSSGTQQVFSPELRMELRFFKHLYLRPQVIYTSLLSNDDGALSVPEIFTNTQLAFENQMFKKAINVQLGVDFHWRSAYKAMGYDPAIQQYYIQDSYINQAYPLVDIFFNGQFKRGRFFAKYHNMMQAISKTGYLPTPGYRGVRNLIDFGFDLILFD